LWHLLYCYLFKRHITFIQHGLAERPQTNHDRASNYVRMWPPVLRSYSLSGAPSADQYRVSVKHEVNGLASTYVHNQIRSGDVLDVSAPRGGFTLLSGDGPVVLLSAGVGVTPVLAMLHTLAAESSQREVWWLYGARNSEDHPFCRESRALLQRLQRGLSYIQPPDFTL
jgi:ferredoxin-NADP reductase